MWRDLRHAAASLWRSPLFTISAVAALGLAIGANATIFGLIDALWMRPPGVRDAGALVWIRATTAEERDGLWSWPEYEALRDGTASFSGVIARGRRGTTLTAADGTSDLLLVNVVSTNFFTTLGVSPLAGRLFAPGDEPALEQQPAIVLGYSFWRRQYGGDPAIVGRTVTLTRGSSGVPVTIAGVLPETFRELDAGADRDIWMPPQTWMRLENRQTFARLQDRWFDVLAVRAPSRPLGAAQADVQARVAQLASASPATNSGRGARVVSHFAHRLEDGGTNAFALLGLVLLVVVITCVNVANLLFARGASRARELALRAALGATRPRLVRELLVESSLLGAAGAAAGLMTALWLIRLIPLLLVEAPGFHSSVVFQADRRVLVFTLGLSLLTTILFGVAPSWLAANADVAPLIKGGGPGAGGRRVDGRIGRALAVAQIAISLVLLAAAAALARSFVEIGRADIGVASPRVLTAWATGGQAPVSRMPEARVALERLAALPGVSRVAIAIRAPLSLSGGGLTVPVLFPDRPLASGAAPPAVKFNAVSRDFFAVLGIRLLAGRVFGAADEVPGEPVAIVNQQFVDRFYQGRSPLGARIHIGSAGGADHEIIGVVQNAAINSIAEPPEPYLYLPYWRGSYGEGTFMLATASDAGALAPAVRELLRTDRALEARRLVTMRQYIEYSGSSYRATAALAVGLGTLGLLLTVLGVYGVIAYRTARRTREIGIRMALGANPRDVLGLVLREGAGVAIAGVAIGVPAAMAGTRAIRAMLFRVAPWDASVLGGTAALLFLSVCAAAWLPARRATRVQPSQSLRTS
jgi:predicted permease